MKVIEIICIVLAGFLGGYIVRVFIALSWELIKRIFKTIYRFTSKFSKKRPAAQERK